MDSERTYGYDPKAVLEEAENLIRQQMVKTPDVRVVGGDLPVDALIATAVAQLGTRWSPNPWPVGCLPTNPDRFDSASFVGWVFAQHGVWLGLTYRELWNKQLGHMDVGSYSGAYAPGDLILLSSTNGGEIGIFFKQDHMFSCIRGEVVDIVPIETPYRKIITAYRPEL